MSGPGRLVDIGGRTLHAVIAGEGPVSVVLEAGGFAWSTDWEPVIAALGPDARSLAYDRAGLGWSAPGPKPRDLAAHVTDLDALIEATDLPPPYVLVGASYGGHVARAFAARRRDQVRGLVLVDARHPETSERLPPAWRRLERTAIAMTQAMGWLAGLGVLPLIGGLLGERGLPPAARGLPDARRAAYLAECFGPDAWRTSVDEAQAIAASDAQAKSIGHHGALPLLVLRHDRPDLFAPLGAAAAEAERAWSAMQDELAALSTQGVVTQVEASGHAIARDRPDAVAAAIRSLISRAS